MYVIIIVARPEPGPPPQNENLGHALDETRDVKNRKVFRVIHQVATLKASSTTDDNVNNATTVCRPSPSKHLRMSELLLQVV